MVPSRSPTASVKNRKTTGVKTILLPSLAAACWKSALYCRRIKTKNIRLIADRSIRIQLPVATPSRQTSITVTTRYRHRRIWISISYQKVIKTLLSYQLVNKDRPYKPTIPTSRDSTRINRYHSYILRLFIYSNPCSLQG